MNNLHGSYYILTALPIWATALILYMATQGVLFILRDRYEGLYYNTSYSAVLGDGALVVVGLMAAEILQRGASLPWFVQGWDYHQVAGSLGALIGIIWLAHDCPKQWGDRYHHAFIAPLLCYLGLTLLPVIFWNGTWMEIAATIILILLWAVLVVYDAKTNRLDQRNYRKLGMRVDAVRDYDKYHY